MKINPTPSEDSDNKGFDLNQLVAAELDDRVEGMFSHLDKPTVNRLKRLYHQAWDLQENIQCRQPLVQTPTGWMGEVMAHLSLQIFDQLTSVNERDPNSQMVKTIISKFGFGSEGEFVDLLALREGLQQMRSVLPQSLLCIQQQFFLGLTGKEICAQTQFSPQQVRTHVEKGIQFLKERL